MPRSLARPVAVALATVLMFATAGVAAADDELDPVRNAPIPCDDIPAVGTPARTELNLVHIGNKCGIVGTDIEFQSRRDSTGKVRDYAFVGSMGRGMRIFDVTDPTNILNAGGYLVQGWQNEVQVRGDVAIVTFDGLSGEPSTTSTCLQSKPGSNGQGVEVIDLDYDPVSATFTTSLIDCLPNPPGGAHNATFHPSGKWLAISNSSSDWAVDVMDLTKLGTTQNAHVLRLIDESRATLAGRCPSGASFTCVIMRRPPAPNLGSNQSNPSCNPSPCPATSPLASASAFGLFRPHDVHFSRDGQTMYVAALNSTFIVNVRRVNRLISGALSSVTHVPTIAILGNAQGEDPTDASDPNNIELSHQADVTADGKILVISDEQGGGVSETGCTTDPQTGVVGALHFWALAPIGRAAIDAQDPTPQNPVRMGIWVNPNPPFVDAPGVDEEFLPVELRNRGCTVHVFRLGGNGTASPGPAEPGFDGVSRFRYRRLSTAFYGAGVWFMDFSKPSVDSDGVAEDPRSTWGNTLGWNIQLGADAWSAKEYKGHIYAGDMIRGFDAYRITRFADPVVELDKLGPPSARAGETVRFEITYRNVGPAASGGGRVFDQLPQGVRFVSASNGGTYDSRTHTVRWNVGTVDVGETGTLVLRVRVRAGTNAGTVLLNRAAYTGIATVSPPTATAATTVVP
jgi:uncharacterized repeat protein (TIGR01451 family)